MSISAGESDTERERAATGMCGICMYVCIMYIYVNVYVVYVCMYIYVYV